MQMELEAGAEVAKKAPLFKHLFADGQCLRSEQFIAILSGEALARIVPVSPPGSVACAHVYIYTAKLSRHAGR